jgi:hypothetical protein
MNKVYHFKVGSLISARIYWLFIICIAFLLGLANGGLKGIYTAADDFGGLWIILIIVVLAFAETFIKLIGHRLEIKDGFFALKTLFGTTWAIPVSAVQRIDPEIRNQKRKGSFFSFTTDNKDYECPYVPNNYKELLFDLQAINPNILLEEKVFGMNVGGMDIPANVPLNKFFEEKLGKDNFVHRALIKTSSLSGLAIFIICFIFMIIFIIGIVMFENYANSIR